MLASQPKTTSAVPFVQVGYGRTISDNEFSLFQRLIYGEAGIYLPEAKKALLVRRLSGRLRDLGLESFIAYYRRIVTDGDEAERLRMLDCVTTNETSFFREPSQFEFLEESLIPAWRREADAGKRPRRLRVWSAACSTGEEPYSVAMLLLRHLPPVLGWEIDILATDLSTRALDFARKAVWPAAKVSGVPEDLMRRFMLKGKRTQVGRVKAKPRLRSVVRFERQNLHDPSYAVNGPFDLILCRNVLIYFDARSKNGVIGRLLDRLSADGHLFVGHAESLLSHTERLKPVIPTVYRFADGTAGAGRPSAKARVGAKP